MFLRSFGKTQRDFQANLARTDPSGTQPLRERTSQRNVYQKRQICAIATGSIWDRCAIVGQSAQRACDYSYVSLPITTKPKINCAGFSDGKSSAILLTWVRGGKSYGFQSATDLSPGVGKHLRNFEPYRKLTRMNLKKVIGILQKISPKLTAKIAFRFVSKPKNRKMRSFEKSILSDARKSSIRFKKFDIKKFEWGNGNKKALVVHGWGGRAANFGAIIPKLIENGYEITSFDAPCHGASTKKKTSFFEISDLVKLFLQKEKYDLVITHSMGSAFALLAMSNLKYKVNQLIILTTPNRFLEFIGAAALHFGLTPKTTKLLINKVRKTSNYEPLTLKASRFVKDIETKIVTFIHDKADKIISIDTSKKVSASIKNSDFIEIEGTGHFRMLWSKKVVQLITDLTSENRNLLVVPE